MEKHYAVDPFGLGNTVGEYDTDGGLTSRCTHGLGLIGKGDLFYTFDGNGNTSEMTDASMAIINYYLYEPFGKFLHALEQVENPFEFAGQLGVRQMGDDLIYMRNRFYAPSTGRFMPEDPIGLAGGDVSFYRYVANDPVSFIDPTGEVLNLATAGAGAVFGGVGGATYSFYSQIEKPGGIDWGAVGESAVAGGALGAISGATFGLGTAALLGGAAGGTLGMASNAFYHDYGNAVQYPWEDEKPEPPEIPVSPCP